MEEKANAVEFPLNISGYKVQASDKIDTLWLVFRD